MKYLHIVILSILPFNFILAQTPATEPKKAVGIDIILPPNSNNLSPEEKKKALSPKATLDVNGTVSVQDVPEFKQGNYDLYIDKDNGEIRAGTLNGSAPLGNIRYKIKCTGGQDWIEDFDTTIPTDKYFIAITNANFVYEKYYDLIGKGEPLDMPNQESLKDKYYGISHQLDASGYFQTDKRGIRTSSVDHIKPIPEIRAFKKDGTWHLTADYRLANPFAQGMNAENKENYFFYWEIDVFAIHQSLVLDYSDTPVRGKVERNYKGKYDSSSATIIEKIKKAAENITPSRR